jgi:hypothetical protein
MCFLLKYYTTEQNPTLLPAPSPLKALPKAKASIVYFEYEPDPNRYEDQQIKLRLERRTDHKLYLVDDAKLEAGRTSYYALNGSVNRIDARQLTQQPILPNRWIHVVKYITDISNINSESWLTSALNVAAGKAKYAAAAELIFWVRDSLEGKKPQLSYTQPLWPNNKAVGDVGIFKQTPAFTLLPNKKYGSESQPIDELVQNLRKVGWHVNNEKFRLMYAGEVVELMQHVRPKGLQGITKFDARQPNTLQRVCR